MIRGLIFTCLLSYMYRPLCFVLYFSSPPNHAEFRTWKINTPLSQAKLFNSPVLRESISIIQKTFLPTGVSWPFKSNKDIASHEFAKRFVKSAARL